MRKITEQAANAFKAGRKFSGGNTTVDAYTADGVPCARMYLHGNEIAFLHGNELLITLAGWPTVTTRERLNGLLTVMGETRGIFQHKHKQYFGLHSGDTDKHEIADNQWLKIAVSQSIAA